MIGNKIKQKFSCTLLIIIAVTLLTQGIALAKESEFRLDIDSLNLQNGISTNLVVSIVNANGADVKEIKGLENFDVLSSMQSTSTQIINGSTTNEKNITYTIMPKNLGDFTLQASVEYKGKTYLTNELQVNVSEASNETKENAEDIFVETSLSENTLFFGQKIALGYKLYSRYNIENFGFLDDVTIDGFMASEIPQDQLKSELVYLNGNKYVQHEAKQLYLLPIKTGSFIIPAYNFQANVSTGDFFNASKPVYLQTESKEITVKPLPQTNQPANFSGIVGNLNIEATYSQQAVEYGDSMTLNVVASGNCNLENLTKIIKDGLPGFSVYETQKDLEESIQDDHYYAKKAFEIILVPEKTGEITVEPMVISYFDPESESYKEAEISGTTIQVNGEMPVQAQVSEENQPTSMETVTIDQVSYKTPSEPNSDYITLQVKKDSLLMGATVLVVLLMAIILILVVRTYRKNDKKLEAIYKQLMKADNKNDCYNSFNELMKYRLNISLKASSRSTVISQLEGANFANLVIDIMDEFEKQDRNNLDQIKNKMKDVYQKLRKG
jgi:hypothetical protein